MQPKSPTFTTNEHSVFAIIILLALSLIFGSGRMMFHQHQADTAAETTRVALDAKQKTKTDAKAKIAASKAEVLEKKLKAKRNNMPIKEIAVGTTAQADFVGPGTGAGAAGDWYVFKPGSSDQIAYFTFDDATHAGDWFVTSDGSITVPDDFDFEEGVIYQAIYDTGETAPDEPGMTITSRYQFKVVERGTSIDPTATLTPPKTRNRMLVTLISNIEASSLTADIYAEADTERTTSLGTVTLSLVEAGEVSYEYEFNQISLQAGRRGTAYFLWFDGGSGVAVPFTFHKTFNRVL